MKIYLIRSLLIISLVTALIAAGTTMAWFTDDYSIPSAAEMVVGTLDFEITDVRVIPVDNGDPEDEEVGEGNDEDKTFPWVAGECKELSWTFRNTGSKTAFFRARPKGAFTQYSDDSAWGEGVRIVEQGEWATCFVHEGGSYEKKLLAGQHHEAGTVRVWEDDGKLYVCYETNENWKLTETHLHVADDIKAFLNNGGQQPAPGQFPYKNDHALLDSYTYEIDPFEIDSSGDISGYYIAAHASLMGGATETVDCDKINWSFLSDDEPAWEKGSDGWYYYCRPVRSGEEIVLELRGCLDEDAGKGLYDVQLIAESVQASHEAAKIIWPDWPGE